MQKNEYDGKDKNNINNKRRCVRMVFGGYIYIYIYIIMLAIMENCWGYSLCLVKKNKLKVRE